MKDPRDEQIEQLRTALREQGRELRELRADRDRLVDRIERLAARIRGEVPPLSQSEGRTMTTTEDHTGERGWYEYECVVCGRLNCSSTITFGYDYGGGSHCGKPYRKVRWVPISRLALLSQGRDTKRET